MVYQELNIIFARRVFELVEIGGFQCPGLFKNKLQKPFELRKIPR